MLTHTVARLISTGQGVHQWVTSMGIPKLNGHVVGSDEPIVLVRRQDLLSYPFFEWMAYCPAHPAAPE